MIHKPPKNKILRLLQFSVAVMLFDIHLPAVADTLYIGDVAAYWNADRVQQAVREECKMDVRLPAVIREEIEKLSLYTEITLVNDPLASHRGLVLVATIIGLDAPRGGGWSSSPKFMKIKAVLYKNGVAVGEFSQSARAGHSVALHKNVRSNCRIVDDLAEELSEEVAAWLKKTSTPPK